MFTAARKYLSRTELRDWVRAVTAGIVFSIASALAYTLLLEQGMWRIREDTRMFSAMVAMIGASKNTFIVSVVTNFFVGAYYGGQLLGPGSVRSTAVMIGLKVPLFSAFLTMVIAPELAFVEAGELALPGLYSLLIGVTTLVASCIFAFTIGWLILLSTFPTIFPIGIATAMILYGSAQLFYFWQTRRCDRAPIE